MTTAVQQEAALAKVARVLGTQVAEIEFLGDLDITTLAALIDPKMARHFARHLSVDFMADVTVQTDPRCVSGIVEELPPRIMQAIATNLLVRGDHFTLSHFVAYVPPPVVIEILDAIEDDATLVRIATHVEGLFSALSSQQITRVATTLVDTDEGMLSTALAAFERHGLWSEGLRLIDHLGPGDMERIAFALGQVDDDVIEAAVAAADANDLWEPVVRAALVAPGRAPQLGPRVAHLVERIPRAGIARFEEASAALGHPDLLRTLLAAP